MIRRAGPGDAALLTELAAGTFLDAYRDHFERDFGPGVMAAYLSETLTRASMESSLAEPGVEYLLAERDGRPAAYARLSAPPPPACLSARPAIRLSEIYVAAPFQNAGLGSRLLEACLARARERGARALYLGCWEGNAAALRFYARHGFAVRGKEPFPIGTTGHSDTDLILERALSS